MIGGLGGETTATGFSFESGFSNVFADLDGGFAVASTMGVQVFDGGGNKVYTEIFGMSDPAIVSFGALCTAYDLGGRILKVLDTAGVLGTMKTEDKIISASLGPEGGLVLCTQGSGGYKAFVSYYRKGAYDSAKQPPFQWKSGEGYILSAALSPDEKRLAVPDTDGGWQPDRVFLAGQCRGEGLLHAPGEAGPGYPLHRGRPSARRLPGCAGVCGAGRLEPGFFTIIRINISPDFRRAAASPRWP